VAGSARQPAAKVGLQVRARGELDVAALARVDLSAERASRDKRLPQSGARGDQRNRPSVVAGNDVVKRRQIMWLERLDAPGAGLEVVDHGD
jgi:hypothetical protein